MKPQTEAELRTLNTVMLSGTQQEAEDISRQIQAQFGRFRNANGILVKRRRLKGRYGNPHAVEQRCRNGDQ